MADVEIPECYLLPDGLFITPKITGAIDTAELRRRVQYWVERDQEPTAHPQDILTLLDEIDKLRIEVLALRERVTRSEGES